jgi:hypothetical protein
MGEHDIPSGRNSVPDNILMLLNRKTKKISKSSPRSSNLPMKMN